MPKLATFVFLAAAALSVGSAAAAQQDTPGESISRKVVTRLAPTYPELAKRMHLAGSVRIEAVIRPNGSVKSTRVVGGNPVLVQAAADAVTKWKFETGPNETTEIVQLTFVPQ